MDCTFYQEVAIELCKLDFAQSRKHQTEGEICGFDMNWWCWGDVYGDVTWWCLPQENGILKKLVMIYYVWVVMIDNIWWWPMIWWWSMKIWWWSIEIWWWLMRIGGDSWWWWILDSDWWQLIIDANWWKFMEVDDWWSWMVYRCLLCNMLQPSPKQLYIKNLYINFLREVIDYISYMFNTYLIHSSYPVGSMVLVYMLT